MSFIKNRLLKIKSFFKNSTFKDWAVAIKNSVTSDFVPKLLCVFSAFCLWMYVIDAQSPTFEKTFSGVEVVFEKGTENNSGFEVLSSGVKYVDVELTGKKSEVMGVSLSDIRATVDISHITKAGEYPLDVNVVSTKEVSVRSVNPGSIYVYVDKPSSRSIPVEADYTGGTSDDKTLKIGELTTSKSFITVTGPQEEIFRIAKAEVTVSVDQISNSINIRGVEPVLVDSDGNVIDNPYIKLSDSNIDVYVPVFMEKEVPIKTRYLYDIYTDNNLTYKASPDSVVIRGEVDDISKISEIYTDIIDDSTLGVSTTLQLNYQIPDGVSIVGAAGKCKVTLSVAGYKEKNIILNTRKVEVTELHEELDANVSKSVLITVCGSGEAVNNFTANNLSARIRLGNFSDAGAYEGVPISVVMEDGIKNVFIKNEYSYTTDIIITEKEEQDENNG